MGLSRANRTSILRSTVGRTASKLYSTGVKPQATYGQSCIGLATNQLRALQRAALKVAGTIGIRPCSTTLIHLRLGIMPAVQLQCDQIKLWLNLWQKAGNRPELMSAWRSVRDSLDALPKPQAWSKVSGPIGATIMTLKEASWRPLQAHLWSAPGERIATLSAQEPHAHHNLQCSFDFPLLL